MLYHVVRQHHHVYLILYHGMFHLVTTCVCRVNHIHLRILGEWCRGVTAGKDKIYIGGVNKVIILNIDGSLVRKISTDRVNYNLLYNVYIYLLIMIITK
jgi:hypothetical protein